MTIVYDANTVEEDVNPNAPVTFAHTTANESNRLLIVSVMYEHSVAPENVSTNGVTYDGVVCSKVDATNYISTVQTGAGYTSTVEMYYLLAPSTGSNTVSVTFDNDAADPNVSCVIMATTFYNVKQSAPEDTDESSDEPVTTRSCSVTPGSATNLCFSAICIGYESNGLEAGADDTVLGNAKYEDLRAAVSYEIDGTSGGETMNWTATGSPAVAQRMVMIAATWQETGGDTPMTISGSIRNSGCTASGTTTATINAFVNSFFGDVTIYWEEGAGGSDDPSTWDNYQEFPSVYSGQCVSSYLTDLSKGTEYAFRSYISSINYSFGGTDLYYDDWTSDDTGDWTKYDEGSHDSWYNDVFAESCSKQLSISGCLSSWDYNDWDWHWIGFSDDNTTSAENTSHAVYLRFETRKKSNIPDQTHLWFRVGYKSGATETLSGYKSIPLDYISSQLVFKLTHDSGVASFSIASSNTILTYARVEGAPKPSSTRYFGIGGLGVTNLQYERNGDNTVCYYDSNRLVFDISTCCIEPLEYIAGWNKGEDWANSSISFKTRIPIAPIITDTAVTISGNTTATIGAQVDAGSGNVTLYWEEGAGGSDDPATWTNSESMGLYDNGDTISKDLTSLSPVTDYAFRSFISSNGWLAGEDWADSNTLFKTAETPSPPPVEGGAGAFPDMTISGSSCSIECATSRWDVQNYNVVVETWMKKGDINDLNDSITPGAVGELYNILGSPLYYDKTWTASNTIKLTPMDESETSSTLHEMRNPRVIYVKNISSTPIVGDRGWLNVKIEGLISGSGNL